MIQNRIDLLPYNTFGIRSVAKLFSIITSVDDISTIHQEILKENLLILGGGSNLLFTKDFDGLVLKNEIKGIKILSETSTEVLLESGAGENWHEFVLFCIENNYGGLENLSLIPGCVGASPMQNIGAYGVEVKNTFESLQAYHIPSGEIHTFNNADCKFGYRESIFKNEYKGQYIILRVVFRLFKNPKVNTTYGAIEKELEKSHISSPTIKDVSNAVINIRTSKLPNPKEIGNAGSFFKNPVVDKKIAKTLQESYPDIPTYSAANNMEKIAAGWLIEKAGWKGYRFENFGVHKNQALVLVNYGGSNGNDIYNLSEEILRDVQAKFGIALEREVNIH